VEPADRLALFIDNDETFDALKPLLLSAKRSIWILAWVFDPLTRLDPDRVKKSRDPRCTLTASACCCAGRRR
jgi:phosphatidylserine/phosphatidylglycerophosphate/cardiolipin synthase-like enzyme